MKKITTDNLTNLPTREQLETTIKGYIAEDEAVALALLDIDHFMELNDTYGVEAGDRALVNIAQILQEKFPGQAYRISGDEFAISLPGISLEQAFLQMEQLRLHIYESQHLFRAQDMLSQEITATIGVAQYPRDAKDAAALRRSADAALVNAKENGRNQISLPPNEEMIMKSCYYPSSMVRRLKTLAEKRKKKESILLREALSDLLHKHDRIEE
ncbi:GGDEF domain-containing protein [Paenibacillus sp. GSMTC-2017]|uniref:GGDEF domain-containing protein n=1 Tax=Paenibacillus sp. GSMTC-2017 TaxID=2794350 RepID=UPI0018D5FD9E|nr:GGDEF domain-containing protein [Paenibacillus sp. GSMTC-2017]